MRTGTGRGSVTYKVTLISGPVWHADNQGVLPGHEPPGPTLGLFASKDQPWRYIGRAHYRAIARAGPRLLSSAPPPDKPGCEARRTMDASYEGALK